MYRSQAQAAAELSTAAGREDWRELPCSCPACLWLWLRDAAWADLHLILLLLNIPRQHHGAERKCGSLVGQICLSALLLAAAAGATPSPPAAGCPPCLRPPGAHGVQLL